VSGARILFVDDEPDFRRIVEGILKKAEFDVVLAEDGVQALALVRASPPDLILLDWNLPGRDGLSVCQALKADPATRGIPVILLTVRSREAETVLGFEVGADDYISKRSLRPRELVARVRAALRTELAPAALRSGSLVVDLTGRTATLGGTLLDLRRKEFDLLAFFLKNPGRVFTRSQITEAVWGAAYFGTSRTVDTTLGRLRLKIGAEGKKLRALRGLGYKFEPL
jgi:DNA-binding response OmpR family regulator